jgi:hypothetical protein
MGRCVWQKQGERPLSIVEPPLPTGAIAWPLFVGRDERQWRSSAESGHSVAEETMAGRCPRPQPSPLISAPAIRR